MRIVISDIKLTRFTICRRRTWDQPYLCESPRSRFLRKRSECPSVEIRTSVLRDFKVYGDIWSGPNFVMIRMRSQSASVLWCDLQIQMPAEDDGSGADVQCGMHPRGDPVPCRTTVQSESTLPRVWPFRLQVGSRSANRTVQFSRKRRWKKDCDPSKNNW